MKLTSPAPLRIGVTCLAVVLAIPLIWDAIQGPVEIRFAYSSDADGLLGPLVDEFNGSQDVVRVIPDSESSGSILSGIVEHRMEPHIWMPAASTWGHLLNAREGAPARAPDSQGLFWSPEVIGTFGGVQVQGVQGSPDIKGWGDLLALAAGRSRLDDGAVFRLGHTDPMSSTSGLYALVSEAAISDGGEDAIQALEASVLHYGDVAEEFCPVLRNNGQVYLTAFYMQETTFLKCKFGDRLAEDDDNHTLVSVVPEEQAFAADYPFIILEGLESGDWITPETAAAAVRFREWLKTELTSQPELITSEEYRSGSPWQRNPTDSVPEGAGDLPEQLAPIPSAEELSDAQETWGEERKAASVLILLQETMNGAEFDDAIGLVTGFIMNSDLPTGTQIDIRTFGEEPQPVDGFPVNVPEDDADREALEAHVVASIGQHRGDTALGKVLFEVATTPTPEDRINAVVIIANGDKASDDRRLDDALQAIDDTWANPSPLQVFTISFGDPQGDAELLEIAESGYGSFADARLEGDELYDQDAECKRIDGDRSGRGLVDTSRTLKPTCLLETVAKLL